MSSPGWRSSSSWCPSSRRSSSCRPTCRTSGDGASPPLSGLQDRLRDWLDGVRDRVVVPAVSWSVRNITLTLVCAVLVVTASVWLLRSETVRIIVLDKDANLSGDVQADLELPRRRTVRRDARDRGAFRRRRSRRQRPARGDGSPVGQHRRGQHRLDPAGCPGRGERQSPGVGEAAPARTADPHGVARGDRTAVAPAGRRRVLPGKGGVPDHPDPGPADRRVCGQARRRESIGGCGDGAAGLHVHHAGHLRDIGQPVARQAPFRDTAHTGREGGGTDAGVAGKAVARQLQWRGGAAHPARPRRDQGDGAISRRTASKSERACERTHHPARGRRVRAGGEAPRRTRRFRCPPWPVSPRRADRRH